VIVTAICVPAGITTVAGGGGGGGGPAGAAEGAPAVSGDEAGAGAAELDGAAALGDAGAVAGAADESAGAGDVCGFSLLAGCFLQPLASSRPARAKGRIDADTRLNFITDYDAIFSPQRPDSSAKRPLVPGL
jgi:hypothetical protein